MFDVRWSLHVVRCSLFGALALVVWCWAFLGCSLVVCFSLLFLSPPFFLVDVFDCCLMFVVVDLFVFLCLLFVGCWLWCVVRCLSFVVKCHVLVVISWLCIVWWVPLFVDGLLFCCFVVLLFVVCCLLLVWCSLFVGC